MPARMAAAAMLAAGAALLLAAGTAHAQTEQLQNPQYFAPIQLAGDQSTGFAAYEVGCADTGATLQDIIVFANDNFLRGIEVLDPPSAGAHVMLFLTCQHEHARFVLAQPDGHLPAVREHDVRQVAIAALV